MNEGAIWWEQLGTSRRFLSQIKENMEAANSVVLHIPEKMPWKNYFYTMVDLQKASFSGDRQLQRIEWQPGGEPGAFVLERLCTRIVRADYYPGLTYAQYLGSRDDILLCDYYVWITGIDTRDDLNRWTEFVAQYNDFSKNFSKRAIFILEYAGPSCMTGQIPCLSYPLDHLDRQVFCLELASALANTSQCDFQAELALRVGGDDPELSALLLGAGDAFIKDPVGVTQSLTHERRRSDYTQYRELTAEQISSAVWEADIVTLFPVLEQWRLALVSKYASELRRFLPIQNSYGEQVNEPFDLELSSLLYIGAQSFTFSKPEYEQLKVFRAVRNKLAHNQAVPIDEAYAVLTAK